MPRKKPKAQKDSQHKSNFDSEQSIYQQKDQRSSRYESILPQVQSVDGSVLEAFNFDSDSPADTFSEEVDFTTKQWILLAMAKFIPAKKVKVDMENNVVSGEEKDVKKFCKQTRTQIERMKMKVIKFKHPISVNIIEYEMEREWNCRIFTVESIQTVAQKLKVEYPKSKKQIGKVVADILKKDGINDCTRFMWIESEFYEEGFKVMQELNSKHKNRESQSDLSTLNYSAMSSSNSQLQSSTSASRQSKRSYREEPIIQKNGQRVEVKKKYEDEPSEKSSSSDDAGSSYLDMVRGKGKHKTSNRKTEQEVRNFKKPFKRVAEEKSLKEFEKLLDQQCHQYEIKNESSRRENYEDLQNQSGESRRRGNRTNDNKVMFCQTYPEKILDTVYLKNWVHNNRHLKPKELQIIQKYSEQDDCMVFEVVYSSREIQKEKEKALNLFFKHERAIQLLVKGKLREEVVSHFSKQISDHLKINYKIVNSNESKPNSKRLWELSRRPNNHGRNEFHVFVIKGLQPLVKDKIAEIESFITEKQEASRQLDVELSFNKISDFLREERVVKMIEDSIQDFMKKEQTKYKLLKTIDGYGKIVVQFEALNADDKSPQHIKESLTFSLQGLVESHDFEPSKCKDNRQLFQKLKDEYILIDNQKEGVTLITRKGKFAQELDDINTRIVDSSKSVKRQIRISEKSRMKLALDFALSENKTQFYKGGVDIIETQIDDEFKIILSGRSALVESLKSDIEQFLEGLDEKILRYSITVEEEEIEILQKAKDLQKKFSDIYHVQTTFNKSHKIAGVLTLVPDTTNSNYKGFPSKVIQFERSFNFLELGEGSLFIFTNWKQVNAVNQSFILQLKSQIKSSIQSKDILVQEKVKNCHLAYSINAQPKTILSTMNRVGACRSTYLYLPEGQPSSHIKELIQELITDPSYQAMDIKITIICPQNTDLEALLGYRSGYQERTTKKQKKWFAVEGGTALPYSQKGNDKINATLKSGKFTVELDNEDLNLKFISHKLDFNSKILTHLKSGKQFPVAIDEGTKQISFSINGKKFSVVIPSLPGKGWLFWKSQSDPIELSIGFYHLDLIKKVQTNLFSGYQRDIGCQEIELERNLFSVKAEYDIEVAKVELQYTKESQKQVKRVQREIEDYLTSKKIFKVISTKDGTYKIEAFNNLREDAENEKIDIQTDMAKNQVKLSSYSEKSLTKFLSIVQKFKGLQNFECVYPSEWEIQSKDIQTFVVGKHTDQFARIQQRFTAGKITELIRIQNKIVYQRFAQERQFVEQLNKGVRQKQMQLFHGTSDTDPRAIYEDKEECFNINYTSEHNLLGKGIYFAERSQYSVGYSYPRSTRTGGEQLQMFMCQVIVGESQKCPKHGGHYRDTEHKNKFQNLRYESMTDFLQGSNVYVVYKSKRAYPLYLIKFRK